MFQYLNSKTDFEFGKLELRNCLGFRISCLGFLLSAFLVGCAGNKSRLKLGKTSEGEVVEAEGLAPYNSKDLIATKKASLTDAQRNAVEKAVGVFVSARTL